MKEISRLRGRITSLKNRVIALEAGIGVANAQAQRKHEEVELLKKQVAGLEPRESELQLAARLKELQTSNDELKVRYREVYRLIEAAAPSSSMPFPFLRGRSF